MDTKKICIGIIIVLVIIIIISCGVTIFESKQLTVASENTFTEDDVINELIQENTSIQNVAIENTLITNDNVISDNTNSNIKAAETKKETELVETSTKIQEKRTSGTTSKSETKKSQQKSDVATSKKQTETTSQDKIKTTSTNNTSTTEEKSKTKTEEKKYVRNDKMIATMKKAINDNASADMKEYGYNIVVDSSITELTNQFTYTEKRIKEKITYKAGTIKIYAQDYYKNGELIYTECFIL